ncbi:MAG: AAA family ATPase [Euzebya sp.]
MQPRELTISGLTSFSERVTLDFTDATLFALVGPTGAGKSSVVDAMTLALYGRIPRLHANEIAPAISTNASECTVGLTFTVRHQPYRAVRTVRRTKTGASTLEAALDQLDDDGNVVSTLAGTAEDVTTEIEALLGLSFDEFTRAVVLPQGEFARVLKAKTSDRQNLLARLLGTGIYDRVKQRAGAHGRSAQQRAEQTAHQIAQLGAVDQDQVQALQHRVAELDELVSQLTTDTAQLLDIRESYTEAQKAAAVARDRVERLTAIEQPPKEVLDLADAIATADQAVEKLTGAQHDADTQLTAAEEAAGDPTLAEELSAIITGHQRTTELTADLTRADAALPDLRQQIEQLTSQFQTAAEAAEQATLHQSRIHREHAAVQASHGLAPGDDCPVCAATLTQSAPALQADASAGTAAVAQAASDLKQALQRSASTQTLLTRAESDLKQATLARDQAAGQLSTHLAALEGKATLKTAQTQLAHVREQQQRLAGLRTVARQARDDVAKATRVRQRLSDQAAGLGQRLDRLRLAVAELDPPSLSGQTVADWAALHEWAGEQLAGASLAAAQADRGVETVKAEGTTLRSAMEQACLQAGVEAGTADPRDRAVQARSDAAAEVARMQKVATMVTSLRAEEVDAREQAVIGAELARLLRADQFQKWLLDEATRALVAGASTQLNQLSSGRYELTLDARGAIQVADLSSAGMTRSVRTLSGGETFLASLALALSLAEQIAESATGPVALESLFIDEGFGALDPETLDIAAGAIEQLGAGERTVGVITHVADMADRMPTQFVVKRTVGGSRVERVDI